MDWALSAGGHKIEIFKNSPNGASQESRPLLLLGGLHGDEPEGVWLAQRTLHWLQSTEAENPQIIKTRWLLIPCINPDGFKKNQRTNSRGVDLNRNFPSKTWEPTSKAPRYFPGKGPASEPEVQSLVELIRTENPWLIVHCHSWNPCIVVSGEPGMKYGHMLAECSGYPIHEDIGYPTPGSLGEYGWKDLQIPVICIESPMNWEKERVWPPLKPGITKLFMGGHP